MAPAADKRQPLLKGACPVSGEAGGTCPIDAFQLPQDGYKNHPGGQHHLKSAAESDCPGLLFLAYHIGYDLDGRIAGAVKALGIKLPEQGPFFKEVHEMVGRIKEEHKGQHAVFVAYCLVITVALLGSILWFVLAPSMINALVTSFLFEVYFLNIFHTRHHKGGKLYDIPCLDAATDGLYTVIDQTWGYNPAGWRKNHHLAHHMHTNEENEDPDIPAMYPLVRMFGRQQRYWFHTLQTLYWPLLLPFSVARFPIQNAVQHGGSVAYLFLWLSVMFVLPCSLHGKAGLGYSLLVQGLTGVTLTSKFAVSHSHVELVEHSEKTQESRTTTSETKVDAWLANQIEESCNWGGYWSTLLFGGINLQIEHHVAPGLDPPLLWYMARELKPICVKHGIRYTTEPTLLHALLKFHQRLWVMGQAEA
eukprot:gb/GFBE01060855.1/.p1 GENE.gb/GFBE01060855.1/~~gb/GFBE01060855.1/.p1  ORF type:complete len:419 (+),score=72.27 gb/GFBE01060855.1/:1-1257(+)